jgi:hypothetical protein
MKTANVVLMTIIALIGLAMISAPDANAQAPQGLGGYFSDQDGDGIPNCLDSDYVMNPKDGSGYQHGKFGLNQSMGICGGKAMNKSQNQYRKSTQSEKKYQKKVGASGCPLGLGTGVCDGTGPHGKARCTR